MIQNIRCTALRRLLVILVAPPLALGLLAWVAAYEVRDALRATWATMRDPLVSATRNAWRG